MNRKFVDRLNAWQGPMLSLLRIVAGFVFLTVGTMKVFHLPVPTHPMPAFSLAHEIGWAGLLETVGGLAILLGLLTRPVAFILSGQMAVAYFQVHFPKSFFPGVNGGMPAVLFCFIFLYFVFSGPGPWSLDQWFATRRAESKGDSPPRHI